MVVHRSGIPADTTEEAYGVWIDALRRLGEEGRLRQSSELSRTLVERIETGIRHRHPDYAPRQVFLARVRLFLGDDLFRAAYRGEPLLPA